MGSVEIVFDGDGRRLMQLLSRMDRKYSETLGSMEQKTKKTFGEKGVEDLKKWAAGFASIGAAIAAATQALDVFNERSKQAADRVASSSGALGRLVQVAKDSKDQAYLESKAAEFSRVAGVPLSEAANMIFDLNSAQVPLRGVRTFGEAHTIGIPAGPAAKAAATLMSNFGEGETGSFRQILSKGMAASAGSPEAMGPILEAAAGVGGLARQLGFSDEETMAAVQVLATSTGSASQGKTQLMGVMKAMVREQDRFKGKGLMGGLQSIATGGIGSTMGQTSGQALVKGFGDQEGFLGFSGLMGNVPQFNRAFSDIQAAEQSDLFGQKIGIRNSSELIMAGLQAAQAEQEVAQVRQAEGIARTQGRAAFNRRQATRERSGLLGQYQSLVADALPDFATERVGVDRAIPEATNTAASMIPAVGPIVGLLERIARNTEKPVGGERPGEDR